MLYLYAATDRPFGSCRWRANGMNAALKLSTVHGSAMMHISPIGSLLFEEGRQRPKSLRMVGNGFHELNDEICSLSAGTKPYNQYIRCCHTNPRTNAALRAAESFLHQLSSGKEVSSTRINIAVKTTESFLNQFLIEDD